MLNSDEFFSLSEEFRCENADGGGSVPDFVVLDFGNVDENLGGGVVERDGFEDGGAVVGHGDALVGGGFWGVSWDQE